MLALKSGAGQVHYQVYDCVDDRGGCITILDEPEADPLYLNELYLDSWIEGTSPCTDDWLGVSCTPDGVELVLSGQIISETHRCDPEITPMRCDHDIFVDPDQLLSGDLSSLTSGIRLTKLWLMNMPAITGDLSDLAAMTSLTSIGLDGTAVTGYLSSLAALTSLTFLSLDYTAVAGDLSDLARMTDLTELYLSGTAVTGDVSVRADMPSVTALYLSDTAVTGCVQCVQCVQCIEATGCTFSAVYDDEC
jgi:hypothetical protein